MNASPPPLRLDRRTAALVLLGAAAFAVAYGQAPLYYSNQNQYFLHGLAAAGEGYLREDWLANTADPTPAFSALVTFTARQLHPWAFHVYHGLALAVYAGALLGIFVALVSPDTAARRWPVFLALLMLVHSALARWLSYRVFPLDYPWYFQSGVAGQYLLGSMFQPSVFGVLLLLAVSLFVNERPLLAVFCVALGATWHTTYLLPAGLLTAGFLTAWLLKGNVRGAVAMAILALSLVMPIALFVLLKFGPTSADDFARAQDILVNVRIPHHARPDLWLDPIAGLQIAWIVFAIALCWRTPLFVVLAVPTALATALTLAQVATGSNTLALLFSWRISAVLVPIATAVMLARLVALRRLPLDGRVACAASALAIAGLAAGAVWIMADRQAFQTGDEELALMDHVRENCRSGEVYFLPVSIPDLVGSTHGSLSGDYKPLAAKRKDTRLIPVDLQRFRLATGAPIYIDFKAIPYKDTEVIAWHDRLLTGQRLTRQLREGQTAAALVELRRLGVTHVVVPADVTLAAPGLERPYADRYYRLYRLPAAPVE